VDLCRSGKAIEDGDIRGAEILQQANDAYEAAGGPTADKEIANVLTGLGFSIEQYDKKCSEFSGGWQAGLGQWENGRERIECDKGLQAVWGGGDASDNNPLTVSQPDSIRPTIRCASPLHAYC